MPTVDAALTRHGDNDDDDDTWLIVGWVALGLGLVLAILLTVFACAHLQCRKMLKTHPHSARPAHVNCVYEQARANRQTHVNGAYHDCTHGMIEQQWRANEMYVAGTTATV